MHLASQKVIANYIFVENTVYTNKNDHIASWLFDFVFLVSGNGFLFFPSSLTTSYKPNKYF